jgi:replication fork protection complex subunit Tof1/Swi1
MAMFKDNKLRLLLDLVGFNRLGASDDLNATWVIPPSLRSTELQEAIDLIRKYEFDPPTYEDGKGPEAMLRSKAAASRSVARKVDFDDDSDDIDQIMEEDHGEYAADGPTARKADIANRKVLKRGRRMRTPVELGDDEKERRAQARRKRELERQKAEKSTMFVHDSDDEDWDEDRDAEFFAREEAIRAHTVTAFMRSGALGSVDAASGKKRKAEEPTPGKDKRRKTPPRRKANPFEPEESEDAGYDEGAISSRAQSTEARVMLDDISEDEATDTPLSSQHAPPTKDSAPSTAKKPDVVMRDVDDDEDEDEDEDEVPVARRTAGRRTRAGFIVDSDSE